MVPSNESQPFRITNPNTLGIVRFSSLSPRMEEEVSFDKPSRFCDLLSYLNVCSCAQLSFLRFGDFWTHEHELTKSVVCFEG